jgi:hypothetical protein
MKVRFITVLRGFAKNKKIFLIQFFSGLGNANFDRIESKNPKQQQNRR